jgi:hypothetical protein
MIRFAILLAGLVAAVPAMAQTAPGQPLTQAGPTPWPDPIEDRENAPYSSAGARYAARNFANCVADASPDRTGELLSMDFTATRFRMGLKTLTEVNRYCFGRSGRLRASNLLFAGALAERMLARDTSRPLNVRLARAAMGPATASFSPTDTIAVCTVRSAPDEVAAFLATSLGSRAESAAANTAAMVVARCSQGGKQLSTTVEGLRAMLATAAFRSVYSGARPATGS